MTIIDIIKHKRDGGELSPEEIEFVCAGAADGSIADFQLSAWCMAVFMAGMTDRETADLASAMARSGDSVDLSRFGELSVDKHSTGGVGDKTTLIVAPVMASLGCKFAKMSGRGLGHTGGTVDKLESIEGYRTVLTPEEFLTTTEKTGVCVIGQTGSLAPADKKLYAIRDLSGSIESIPLIASSIMSKKLAAGAHSIVLDVKVGSGAFMKDLKEARKLARAMNAIGAASGRKVTCLLTEMDQPLGRAVGNSLEVIEAVDILKGRTEGVEDVYEVCVEICSRLYMLSRGAAYEESREKVVRVLSDGTAFEKMKEWVAAQGGNTGMLDDTSLFAPAGFRFDVPAPQSGFVSRTDTEKIGLAALELGAGRKELGEKIDSSAGIILHKKPGEKVKKGEIVATLCSSSRSKLDVAVGVFNDAVKYSRLFAPSRGASVMDVIE